MWDCKAEVRCGIVRFKFEVKCKIVGSKVEERYGRVELLVVREARSSFMKSEKSDHAADSTMTIASPIGSENQ